MSRMDIGDVAMWTAYIVITLFVVLGLAALSAVAYDGINNGRAKVECGRTGATVEIYGKNDEFWRCVKPAERAP